MHLLRQDAPQTDESPLGYYRRLSEENRLSGWPELALVAGVSRSPTGLLGRPDHIAQVLGLEVKWTREVTTRDATLNLLQRFQRGQFDAVCPQCLVDSPHLRLHWAHVYSTACVKHRVRLIDHCDRCKSRLSTKRPLILSCDCGHDLRSVPTTAASDSQLWLSAAFAGTRRAQSPLIEPALGMAKALPLTKLVNVLCTMFEPSAKPARRNAAVPRTVAEAVDFLRPLDGLLATWPAGFDAHVLRRLQSGNEAARTMNTALGAWYREIKKHNTACPELPFLEAINRVAATNFPGLIGLDAAGTKGVTIDKPMSVRQTADRLGVGRDAVLAAVDSKVVAGRAVRFGERRLMYQVAESEVERVKVARTLWISREEACHDLDVPTSVLDQLIRAGAVLLDKRWREDILKGGAVSRASVVALTTSLRRCSGVTDGSADSISIREMNGRRVGDKRALQTAFQEIVSGRLCRVGDLPPTGIGGIRFQMTDIREFFGTPIVDSGLTVERLEAATGWKSESIYHWLNEGLLECESVNLRGQRCRVVTPEQLLRFTRTYMPLSDIAKALGSRSGAMATKLRAITLVGAKLLPNGASRGALVRVEDLARLAIGGAETQHET